MKKFARHAIFYAGLLAIWALLAKLKIWPPYVFPTPWGVLEALVAGFKDHSFWIAIAVSMKRMLLGYALSVVLGMILGLGVASNKFLEETMGGLLVSLGLGQLLMMGRDLNDMSLVIAVMILIIAIGYIVDGLVFKTIERRLQQKWGLTPAT